MILHKLKHQAYLIVPQKWKKASKNFYYDRISYPLHAIKFKHKYGVNDFFNAIAIETNTWCNLRCTFCPNSKFERGLKKNSAYMDMDLIKKIIGELVELRFDGMIMFHYYGEPLIDDRLTEIVSYIRSQLPENKMQINSNGFLLTIDKYNELTPESLN